MNLVIRNTVMLSRLNTWSATNRWICLACWRWWDTGFERIRTYVLLNFNMSELVLSKFAFDISEDSVTLKWTCKIPQCHLVLQWPPLFTDCYCFAY